MAKDTTMSAGSILQDLVQPNLYKRNQGKITRQITAIVLFAAFVLAARAIWVGVGNDTMKYVLTALVAIGGAWLSYRIVNLPRFADFLIAVEAEMSKVSWPSQAELISASLVVIILIIAMAAFLFAFDFFWLQFFKILGVRQV